MASPGAKTESSVTFSMSYFFLLMSYCLTLLFTWCICTMNDLQIFIPDVSVLYFYKTCMSFLVPITISAKFGAT